MLLVYTTCKNKQELEKIASHLIKKKLIGCVNFFPITSLYKWKGKNVKDKEICLLLKTQPKNFKKIQREIERIHSYECPCIIAVNAKANKKYERWLKSETNA
ncbi:MAG: divalent-cation tolerance protein CutA [Candidatus Woesearchaeota archaeon]